MLSQEQLNVVNSDKSKIIVQAGAGTGKTFTLLSKIDRLISQKVPAQSILILTFTNSATAELLKRIRDFGLPSAIKVSTFHSFCYELISTDVEMLKAIGYEKVPKLLSEEESQRLIETAKTMSRVKLSSKKCLTTYKPKLKEAFDYKVLMKTVESLLLKNNEISFDFLSFKVSEAFKHNKVASDKYKSIYKHIFIDEFQDTDPTQWEFVKSFKHSNICVIGDINQALYGFRGATSKIMEDLCEDDNWSKYPLSTSYRLTKPICQYCNSIFTDQNHIDLNSDKDGTPVIILKEHNIVEAIKHFKTEESSKAILVRTNAEVEEIKNRLRFESIPFVSKLSESSLLKFYAAFDETYIDNYLWSNLSKYTQRKLVQDSVLNNLDRNSFNNNLKAIQNELLSELDDYRKSDEFKELRKKFITNSLGVNNKLTTASKSNSIYIGTVHSVKGQEFDEVCVFGVNSSSFRLNSRENMNIFYVGCSRAKSNLIVCEN